MTDDSGPLISVVIPARNSAQTIDEQLLALVDQRFDSKWEIVVADNGSTDQTKAVAERIFAIAPELCGRVVDASNVRGVCAARNAGVNASRGDRIAICDSDDVVGPNWLSELFSALDDYDIVAGTFEEHSLNSGVGAVWHRRRSKDFLPEHLGFLPYAGGANMALKRNVFEEVGGWDESFNVGGGDDIDFCWRAQLSGFTIGLAKRAEVAYRLRSTNRENFRQWHNYSRGDAQLYRRYRDWGIVRPSIKAGLRTWIWLALKVGHLRRPGEARDRYIRKLARASGRVRGTIEQRVLFL